MSTTKRIAVNFSWLSIGEVAARGFGFLTVIYLARVLGAAAFGLLNFAQAFLAYLVLMVDSGLSIYGTREIARETSKTGPVSLNIFAIRLFLACVIFIISSSMVFLINMPFEMRLLFVYTFLFVFYRALNADWVFQGLEKMGYIALSRVLFSALVFVATILLVRQSHDLVRVPLIHFIAGISLSLIFLYLLFKRFASAGLEHLKTGNWWDYFSESIPLGVSYILVQIYYNIDTIMLGFMKSVEVVGLYNAAYKLFFGGLLLFGLWQSTAFPVVSRRISSDKASAVVFLKKYLRIAILFGIPVSFLITFLAPSIIQIVYGPSYLSCSIVLQILIWSILPIIISGTYGMLVLVPLGKNKLVLYGVLSGAVVNIILNLMLIPPYGFIGASVATLLAEIIVGAVMFFFAYKEMRLGFLGLIFKPIAGALFSLLAVDISRHLFIIKNILISFTFDAFLFCAGYVVFILLFGEGMFLKSFFEEVFRAGGGQT
jgi:O-antigen/teichoic acid export membrane protein